MNIAVVDDEKEVRYYLKKQIMEQKADHSIYLYAAGEEFLSSEENFDIVFLDIQMKGIDGIETARVLRKQHKDMILIFITGRKEYVFQAFDVMAFHYLVKPIEETRFAEVFHRAVQEAVRRQKRAGRQLFVKTKDRSVTMEADRIVYIESMLKKVRIRTTEGMVEAYGSIKELERQLGQGFYRCHRAYLVNMAYITEYNFDTITLAGGQKVYLSKHKHNEFVKVYMKFLRSGGVLLGTDLCTDNFTDSG